MHNRWSNDDPNQGSAFHELVALPTLAPHLARPYHLPGTPEYMAAQANLEQASGTVTNDGGADTAATEGAGEQVDPDMLVNAHRFFVHVTLEWTERSKTARSTRSKKQEETKSTPDALEVLNMSRTGFVPAALTAHGYQNAYIPGPTSGPGMQVTWTGHAGGKKRAPIIQDDSDWDMMKAQLRQQVRRTKGKLDTICVTFDLDLMEGYKNRKQLLSPHGVPHEADQMELMHGTHVPSVATFSAEQVATGQAIEDIKASWHCDKHGYCFITKDADHIELNRFRLQAWATAILAGQCVATGAPPNDLLQAWVGCPRVSAIPLAKLVPRGRSGPGRTSSEVSTSDTTNLLLTTVVPMVTMMAHNITSTMQKSSRHRTPPSSPPRQSSPPPAIEDELQTFLNAFGRAKGISADVISDVHECLRDAHYSPDAIAEQTLLITRLQELTNLPEGQVYSL